MQSPSRVVGLAFASLASLVSPARAQEHETERPGAVLFKYLQGAGDKPELEFSASANCFTPRTLQLDLLGASPKGRVLVFDDPHWSPDIGGKLEPYLVGFELLGLEVWSVSPSPKDRIWQILERSGAQVQYAYCRELAVTKEQENQQPYEMWPGGDEVRASQRLDGAILGLSPNGDKVFSSRLDASKSNEGLSEILQEMRLLAGVESDWCKLIDNYNRAKELKEAKPALNLLYQLLCFDSVEIDNQPLAVWVFRELQNYPVTTPEVIELVVDATPPQRIMAHVALRGGADVDLFRVLQDVPYMREYSEFFETVFDGLYRNAIATQLILDGNTNDELAFDYPRSGQVYKGRAKLVGRDQGSATIDMSGSYLYEILGFGWRLNRDTCYFCSYRYLAYLETMRRILNPDQPAPLSFQSRVEKIAKDRLAFADKYK